MKRTILNSVLVIIMFMMSCKKSEKQEGIGGNGRIYGKIYYLNNFVGVSDTIFLKSQTIKLTTSNTQTISTSSNDKGEFTFNNLVDDSEYSLTSDYISSDGLNYSITQSIKADANNALTNLQLNLSSLNFGVLISTVDTDMNTMPFFLVHVYNNPILANLNDTSRSIFRGSTNSLGKIYFSHPPTDSLYCVASGVIDTFKFKGRIDTTINSNQITNIIIRVE